MYLTYAKKGDVEYAYAALTRSEYREADLYNTFIGIVVDKERGIFFDEEIGYFTFDAETGEYESAPDGIEDILPNDEDIERSRPLRTYAFGDIYVLCQFLRTSGLASCLEAACALNPYCDSEDETRELLCFYTLDELPLERIHEWWKLTFAQFLFPGLSLTLEEARDILEDFGAEDTQRQLMGAYHQITDLWLTKDGPRKAILIDAMVQLNSKRLPVTHYYDERNKLHDSAHLIFALERETNLPLTMHHVPADDDNAVTDAIHELSDLGFEVDLALVDAGCFDNEKADALIEAGVPFIARAPVGSKVYEDTLGNLFETLRSDENELSYPGRPVYVSSTKAAIGTDGEHEGYAYLCQDLAYYRELVYEAVKKAEAEDTAKVDDELAYQGIFVLVSDHKVPEKDLIEAYDKRDGMEGVFEVSRAGTRLSMSIESQEVFDGHLMMHFMARAARAMMGQVIAERTPEEEDFDIDDLFYVLHSHAAVDMGDALVTSKPFESTLAAYEAFGLALPKTLYDGDIAWMREML